MSRKTLGVIGLGSMGYDAAMRFTAALTSITLPVAAAAKEAA